MSAASIAIPVIVAIVAYLYAHPYIRRSLEVESSNIFAQDNSTYYRSIDLSASGNVLRNSLYNLIKRQRVLSYKEVWEAMEDIDQENCSRGRVFDIYSGRCWIAVYDRCGAGGTKSEGQCFNREHTWPKSW